MTFTDGDENKCRESRDIDPLKNSRLPANQLTVTGIGFLEKKPFFLTTETTSVHETSTHRTSIPQTVYPRNVYTHGMSTHNVLQNIYYQNVLSIDVW